MTDRTERNAAIIRQLEIEANLSAASYIEDVEEFQRLYRLERMQDVVFDLAEWIEEAGDGKRLADLGVVVEDDDQGLRFKQGRRAMAILPRDDMSISVGGKAYFPDADCPVLDKAFYDEVMSGVFAWADLDADRRPKRCVK
ncbi:MAG: hypothetical protein KJ622_05775 [Alphaproteobacteria bacterium]|nr:hypothetical protein [Alphaproteobacteria bacterium]